jgi:hypothetical protein
MWNPKATIKENHAVLFVVPIFPQHSRKGHFLEVKLEVKKVKY